MIYRNYIAEDKKQIKELCEKYDIGLPERSMLFVAEDDNDKIVGFIGIKGEVFIEPLISENPVSAVKLFEKAIKHFKNSGIKTIRCICKKEFAETYKKAGFYQVEEEKILMEKEI